MGKIADFFVELGLKKDKFDKGMKDAENAPRQLNNHFKNLALGIASAFSVGAIISFTKAAMAGYDQQAKAEAGLLQALKGRSDIQEMLINQASELQGKTLFGDEVTIAAQKQLAALGMSGKQIKELIPLIQDYSTVTGQDLNSAAMLVGKSVMTGTNALSRYGVELDATMTSTEKAAEIQRIFNERYGGQAEAAAKVGTGAITQASNAFGDLAEVIGKVITTNTSGFFQSLTKTLSDTTNVLNSDAIPTWRKLFGLINAGIGGANSIEAQLYAKWKENHDKELNARLDNIDKIKQENQAKLNALKDLIAQNEATIKLRKEREKDEYAKKLEEQKKQAAELAIAIDEMNYSYEKFIKTVEVSAPADSFKDAMKAMQDIQLPEIDEEVSDEDPAWLTKLGEDLIKAKEAWDNFSNEMSAAVSDFAANVIGTLFEDIGEAIVSGGGMQQSLNDILSMFGDFIGQLGKMMIAYGTAALGFSLLGKNPNPASAIALIAAGAAMTAIGGMIKASMKSGVSGTGMTGTSGGYNQGFDSSDFGAESSLVAEVSGDSLRFLLERSNRNKKRVM